MKIGSRIPIATGSYQTGAATALVSSLVNTQFQYQDVGVNIEMTPNIHFDHDVTLNIKIEVSAESGTETISGVTEPIISQRVVNQIIRLREGEASILGGIQNKQEAVNYSGIPGLGAIPILKYIFGSKDHTIQDDDIVFVVVPHIVRSQELDQANLRIIDTGPGQQGSVELRHSDNTNGAGTPAVVPVARPVPTQPPVMGTIPSQSAIEAAPQMLAQLRSDMNSNGGPAVTAQAAVPPPGSPPVSPTAQQPSQPSRVPAPSAPAGTPTPAPTAPAPPAVPAILALNVPATPMPVGSSFQVPVVLNGGTDVTSLALQLHYDPAKLQLSGVVAGDLLSRDGQPTGLSHVEDSPGSVVVSASRPPGAHGATGTGVVCVLTFQAKAPGQSGVSITRFSLNGAEQKVPAQTTQATIVVK
jgi:general secretion pathway protein D